MSTAGMTLAQANNFMALEPRLVALLEAAVVGMSPAVRVLTAADLAGMKEASQPAPAVHVVYQGYRVLEDIGLAWRMGTTWLAVAVGKSAAKMRSGEVARQEAGVLSAHITGALAGAELEGAIRPLTLVTPPAASYSAPFVYLPTAVMAEVIFRKPQPQQ